MTKQVRMREGEQRGPKQLYTNMVVSKNIRDGTEEAGETMDMLRVVFLWASMREIGGVQTFLRNCITHLQPHGVESYIVETQQPCRALSVTPKMEAGRLITAYPQPWRSAFAYRRAVVRAIAAIRPHLIVTNDQLGWEYLATFGGKAPIIGICHVDYPQATAWEQIAAGSPRLSLLVGVSERIADKLRQLPGCADKVVCIPYGVATVQGQREWPTATKPVILVVGRLVQAQKRVRDLVPFYKALCDLLPQFSLVVVGDGPERSFLERALCDGSGRASFAGSLPPEAIVAQYMRAHFFVQLSDYEGLSIALLEAMGHGVVPVVTAIESGVRQVIDDKENGFLFPVGRPDAAAQLIKASVEAWPELSERAYRKITEGFTIEDMFRRYAAVFRRVAGRPLGFTPPYIDEHYTSLRGRIARRVLPIWIYRSVCGGVL